MVFAWRRCAALLAVYLCTLAGCSDGGTPPREGGTYSVRLTAPAGHTNGAAVIELTGAGIDTVIGVNARAFTSREGNRMRVVLVTETPGELGFIMQLASGSRRPQATIIEVADGTDQLRASLAGYSVSFAQ